MVMAAVGVLSVQCPFCRARPGRVCTTRRGWATTHHQRRAAWLAAERIEVRAGA